MSGREEVSGRGGRGGRGGRRGEWEGGRGGIVKGIVNIITHIADKHIYT